MSRKVINVVMGKNENTIDYVLPIEESKIGNSSVALLDAVNLPSYNELKNIDSISVNFDGQIILCNKCITNLPDVFNDNINYISVGGAFVDNAFAILAYCISISPSNEAYFWMVEGGVEL